MFVETFVRIWCSIIYYKYTQHNIPLVLNILRKTNRRSGESGLYEHEIVDHTMMSDCTLFGSAFEHNAANLAVIVYIHASQRLHPF